VDWNYLLWRFDGRIGRRTFWIGFMTVGLIEFACHLAAQSLDQDRLSSIISLAFGYPEFAILAKRGHDRNMTTWVPAAFYAYSALIDFMFVIGAAGTQDDPSSLVVLMTIPWVVFALALLIELGLRKGARGPNRYGPDPLAPPAITHRDGPTGNGSV
jgi:uncharacterized membrane protein YhaH (DUF805 family)